MIVVDTNVIAYLVIPGAMTPQAEALRQSNDVWVAPTLWRSELRNVLLGYARRREMTLAQVIEVQAEAERTMSGGDYQVASESVFRLAHASGCTTYDCEFIALSIHLSAPLYTADKQLLRAFPDQARSLASRVAGN